jgi:DNA-directed RNA polymerase specialized sigma24 family protein
VVVRNRWRRRLFADYDEAYALSLPSTELSPDDAADVVLLREALQKLPYRTREAVVMFDVLGFALEDIRVIQGGTISGVKSRLVRGRASLIHLLSAADVNKEQQPHSTTSLATARVQK